MEIWHFIILSYSQFFSLETCQQCGGFFIKFDFPVLFKDFQCMTHMFGYTIFFSKNIFYISVNCLFQNFGYVIFMSIPQLSN